MPTITMLPSFTTRAMRHDGLCGVTLSHGTHGLYFTRSECNDKVMLHGIHTELQA